jgi:hypothetical protein
LKKNSTTPKELGFRVKIIPTNRDMYEDISLTSNSLLTVENIANGLLLAECTVIGDD